MTFHLHDIRWMAPEVIQQRNNASMHSDVWSFGMLCLEILTGNIPYSHIRRDVAVLTEIENSRTPPRPEAEVSREVSDGMWSLLQRCWGKDPKARPSMSYVRGQLLNLRGFGFSMSTYGMRLLVAGFLTAIHRQPTKYLEIDISGCKDISICQTYYGHILNKPVIK